MSIELYAIIKNPEYFWEPRKHMCVPITITIAVYVGAVGTAGKGKTIFVQQAFEKLDSWGSNIPVKVRD
ncbi:5159_t:CDS:1, partial [Paraglomus occultum]